jgi:hypothetical protein
MPVQETVSSWGWCKWNHIPYPCKKTSVKWCYQFSTLKETGYGVFSTLEGCEGGVRYCWKAFSLFIFGSTTYYNIKKCFKNQRDSCGKC